MNDFKIKGFNTLKEIFEGGFKDASQATVAPGGKGEEIDLKGRHEDLSRVTGSHGFGAGVFANFKGRIDTVEGVPDLVVKHQDQGLQLGAGLFNLLHDLANQKTSSKS